MKNKLKFKKASLNATDLMKGEDGTFMFLKKTFCLHLTHLSIFLMFTLSSSFFSVPYDSTKAFVWEDYLTACGAKAVPASVFKQVRIFNKTNRKNEV